MIILIKPYYSYVETAKILGLNHHYFWQKAKTENIKFTMQGRKKMLTASTVQTLLKTYNPDKDVRIDFDYNAGKEVY